MKNQVWAPPIEDVLAPLDKTVYTYSRLFSVRKFGRILNESCQIIHFPNRHGYRTLFVIRIEDDRP